MQEQLDSLNKTIKFTRKFMDKLQSIDEDIFVNYFEDTLKGTLEELEIEVDNIKTTIKDYL